jgi:hypothetical protein
MGWAIQSKINDQWQASFVSYAKTPTPFEATDWQYLQYDENREKIEIIPADHLIISKANFKKNEIIVPGMLNDRIEINMLMLRSGQMRPPPVGM